MLPRHDVCSDDPRYLKHVFRDRDELAAASDLTASVESALAASSAVIVVCTPAAAKSDWVDREITAFRSIGGNERIFAALASGSLNEAYPLALLAGVPAHHLPLAADFRKKGDGFRLALLKLVAVLAGVGLDDLIRRDARRRRHRLLLIAAVAFCAIIAAGVLIWTMLQARAGEERERTRSLASVDYALTELRDRAKGAGSLGMRDAANDVAARYLMTTATMSDDELGASAKLLLARGEDSEARGDYVAAQRQFAAALTLTSRLVAARPNDTKRIFDHGQALYWVGFISWRLGASDRAEAAFTGYAAASADLLRIEPDKPSWLFERAYAADNLGMLALRRTKNVTRAAAFFNDELATYREIQRHRPTDVTVIKAMADTDGWLGDIARLRGDYLGAAAARQSQRVRLTALLLLDPRNAELRSAMIANQLAVARIAADSGALAVAVAQFDAGRAAAATLAETDPDDVSLRRKVRVFELFKARAWLVMPPPTRPSPAVIAAAIGDCAAERARAKNTELADFCTVLAARLAAATGDRGGRDALLALLTKTASSRRDALSERWGIDFAHEIEMARTAL